MIPMAVFTLLSNYMSIKVGEANLVRISALLWLISTLILFIWLNYVTFLIFVAFIPASICGLVIVPSYKCLYSYFETHKSKMAGVVIGSMSLGVVFWSVLSSALSNPEN